MTEEITVTIKLGDGSRNDIAPWIVHRAPSPEAMVLQLSRMYDLAIGESNAEASPAELGIEASIKIRAAWSVMTGLGATRIKDGADAKPPAAAVNKKKPDRVAELTAQVDQLPDQASIRAWLTEHRAELRKYQHIVTLARARFDSFKTPDSDTDSKENAHD